jgi:hypothetical protein
LYEFGGVTFQQAVVHHLRVAPNPEQQREINPPYSSVSQNWKRHQVKNEEIAAILRTYDPLGVIVNLALAYIPSERPP